MNAGTVDAMVFSPDNIRIWIRPIRGLGGLSIINYDSPILIKRVEVKDPGRALLCFLMSLMWFKQQPIV